MVSALDRGSSGPGSSLGLSHYSPSASLHAKVFLCTRRIVEAHTEGILGGGGGGGNPAMDY